MRDKNGRFLPGYKPSNKLNLVRKKFGRLNVIDFAKSKNGESYFLCLCECGVKKEIKGVSLKSGNTKSCGCLMREISKEQLYKHGMKKSRFYMIWRNMKTRCYNKNVYAYRNYGERGIIVCKKWLKFKNFRDDMHESYLKHCKKYTEKNTTLERINNNQIYKPSNCKWATRSEQALNRRNENMVWNKK